MKNKLLIILLSFVLMSIPVFAEVSPSSSYHFTFFDDSGLKYIYYFDEQPSSCYFAERYVIQWKRYTDLYLLKYDVDGKLIYSGNPTTYFTNSSIASCSTNSSVVYSFLTESLGSNNLPLDRIVISDKDGVVLPPSIVPPLVSNVEGLMGYILSVVRTLTPTAFSVLCLMLSVALLPQLLKRLMV